MVKLLGGIGPDALYGDLPYIDYVKRAPQESLAPRVNRGNSD